MTKNEFIEKIKNAMDCIVFTVHGQGYTILVWPEEGITINEWNSEKEDVFPTSEALVDGFLVNGIPLGELTNEIIIKDYC